MLRIFCVSRRQTHTPVEHKSFIMIIKRETEGGIGRWNKSLPETPPLVTMIESDKAPDKEQLPRVIWARDHKAPTHTPTDRLKSRSARAHAGARTATLTQTDMQID